VHHVYAALVQLQETLRLERRGWGWKSLTRHHFAHVVQCRDGALKTRTVSVRVRPWAPGGRAQAPRVAQCRGVPLKTERLQVQVLPRGPFWNVNRTSELGLGANECVLHMEDVVQVHGIPPSACSSKRTGGFITRIALDKCRVRERYPARRPFFTSERASLERPRSAGTKPVIETGRRCYCSCSPIRRGTTSRASPVSVRI
jgi:hypothetical protein